LPVVTISSACFASVIKPTALSQHLLDLFGLQTELGNWVPQEFFWCETKAPEETSIKSTPYLLVLESATDSSAFHHHRPNQ
jgi:hypothetical protein